MLLPSSFIVYISSDKGNGSIVEPCLISKAALTAFVMFGLPMVETLSIIFEFRLLSASTNRSRNCE